MARGLAGADVTLTARQPIRRCGRPFADEDEALRSKRGQSGAFDPVACEYGCGQVHLRRKPKAAKDTGPSDKVRTIVLARDGFQCARCGRPCGPGIGQYSLQHRVPRGSGGTSDPGANSPSRLLLLCGTATTGCHGEVESHKDPEDQAKGYRLESWQEPAMEPVMYFSPHGSGFTAWLSDSGDLIFEAPAGGAV